MERDSLVASALHATPLIPPTRRYCLTTGGLHRLARDEGMTVDELLVRCPVSERGRATPPGEARRRSRRLPASPRRSPTWHTRSASAGTAPCPWDAVMTLPDGRTVAVVRQGHTADRTAFSKRLWRLKEVFKPSSVLMLMPDEIRLRHARRVVAGSPFLTFLALESEAATSRSGNPIWRTPSGSAVLDLRTALASAKPRGAWPAEKPPERASLPEDLSLDDTSENTPDWALPATLKETDKRTLDLLFDWPWIVPAHLGELLGVRRSRLSEVLRRPRRAGTHRRSSRRGEP